MNRDSHIAFSPVSQSSFFEQVCCLILVSSQKNLRGYIEFKKIDVTIKKIQKFKFIQNFSSNFFFEIFFFQKCFSDFFLNVFSKRVWNFFLIILIQNLKKIENSNSSKTSSKFFFEIFFSFFFKNISPIFFFEIWFFQNSFKKFSLF